MIKLCNSCKKEKLINEFNFKNIQKQTRQSKCRDCQKIDKNIHYQNNKSTYIQKASKQKKLIREWWQQYKTQFKCSCGESHPACIEFHHTDNNKDADVSKLINDGKLKKAMEEIQKCIPICSNCHRKLHYELRNYNKNE